MKKYSAAARIQDNLHELFQSNLSSGASYIQFQLTADITALLSMERVQESLVIEAEKIASLPNMSEIVLGLINSRNRVFCVFDLAQLIGLPSPLTLSRKHQIIVLETPSEPSIHIGLAIKSFQGMLRLTQETIKPSSENNLGNLSLYSEGIIHEAEKMIPVLKFERILEAIQNFQ